MQIPDQTDSLSLQSFRTTTLEEFDQVALLDRMETKYILPTSDVSTLLVNLSGTYYCLQIAGHRNFRYTTCYFDTSDYLLYRDHHNGYVKRLKVRTRKYEDTNMSFFEIKQKANIIRTLKTRIEIPVMRRQLTEHDYRLINYPHLRDQLLEWKMDNHFQRISLCSDAFDERLSIDTGITLSNSQSSITLTNIAVVEVKQHKFNNSSIAISILKQMGAMQVSFSKYAIGTALLQPQLKQNNFKPTITRLKKYIYA